MPQRGFLNKNVILGLLWLIGVVLVSLSGLKPDPFLEHVANIPPPHPYPTKLIVWLIILMSLHIVILQRMLKTNQMVWWRALIGLMVSVLFFMYGIIRVMHASPAYLTYVLWLFVIVVLILLVNLYLYVRLMVIKIKKYLKSNAK